jgi:hypothetical protein
MTAAKNNAKILIKLGMHSSPVSGYNFQSWLVLKFLTETAY